MLRAFINAFKVPDLRNKILFTLAIMAVLSPLAIKRSTR